MSPLVRRTLVSTLVVGALSMTLFVAPAHAVGDRGSQQQDTPSWSVFSLDFWMGFASSLFGVDLGGDEALADSSPEQLGTVYERGIAVQEPNGFFQTGLIWGGSDPSMDGQN